MQLSSDPTTLASQYTALKNYIDTNFSAIYDQNTVNSLNELASPNFWVWKHVSTLEKTGEAIDLDEIGKLQTAESSRVDVAFLVRPNGIVPSLQSDRALFGDVFSAGAGANTRASLLIEWQKVATEAEKILATGTGTEATGLNTDGTVASGSPATLGDGAFGDITLDNIVKAEANG